MPAPEPRPDGPPRFCSVVVPTRGRPRQLEECLRALAGSTYPRDRFEVVVVGDSLPDVSTLRALRQRLELTTVGRVGAHPAAARNAGVRRASGEILAFTDDDCRPDPEWLRTLTAHVSSGVGAGGHTINSLADNRWSATSQSIIDLAYTYYNGDAGRAGFLTTNNLAVRAEDFRELGGFDERFRTAEDRDFCRRWLGHGFELHYVPSATVDHAHELTLRGFLRQHFDYGRGAFRFHFRSPAPARRQLRNAIGFQAALPRLLGGRRAEAAGGRTPRLADVTLWQAANGAGFAWEAVTGVARRR